jgi:CubicO group peptidase (beta-lactamase class C family)
LTKGLSLPRSLALLTTAALLIACSGTGAQAQTGSDLEALVARVIADLPDSLVTQHTPPQSLKQRMTAAGVPAVSVAVFRDGRLSWAGAWGVRDAVSGGDVDSRTLFLAASISKPLAAMGAVVLADRGKLDLDAEIGTALPGWRAGAAITPRQLLSHSAGLGVSGFPGYAVGQPVPTTLQILQGAPPSRTPAVRVEGPVGGPVRYSGGGYVVLQAMLEARSEMSFEAWMRLAVLAPLGMHDSSFAPPASASAIARAAVGHRVPGGWHIYPESAAAGLWTTPTDLGRAAAALQDQLAGRPSAGLPAELAQRMLAPQAGWFGLGWVLDNKSGEPLFGHTGLNEGFEAVLSASASQKSPQHLVVVMTNGQGGTALAQSMLRAVAREVGWQANAARRVQAVTLALSDLQALEGYYSAPGRAVAVEVVDGVAHLRDGGWQRAQLVPLASHRFAVENRGFDLVWGRDGDGSSRSLTIDDRGEQITLQAHVGPLLAETARPVLRGSHSDWKADHPMVQTGTQAWQLALPLKAGELQFKIAAGDWRGLLLGAAIASPPVAQGEMHRLLPMGGNLRLVVARDGVCRFKVSAPSGESPRLEVDCE